MSPTRTVSEQAGLLRPGQRNQWVRLRTLTGLRWVAVVGQSAALLAAIYWFGLDIPIGAAACVVGLAIIANLIAIFVYPENKRLTEGEALVMLLFDAAQLALLLALTGGLNNPFALLLLTPVTISATALSYRPTAFLGLVTLIMATLIARFHLSLTDKAGIPHELPEIFLLGYWIAIMIGIAFLAFYAQKVSSEISSMSEALLATQMALAREQKLTDLGGVVAAAAHELGTPLATIKLVSSELLEELEDHPELHEDAALIRNQADRCRDILRSMGRAGKDDRKLHTAPLATMIDEAAEPHQDRGKVLHMRLEPPARGDDPREPNIQRRPEVIHGLRNLIQNAVDFADGNVWIDAYWTDDRIGIQISDDGAGYPAHILPRIGDPFMRRRRGEERERPGYDGMGLGLFIAKTLLERSGAELSFANGAETKPDGQRRGAVVDVQWPRAAIGASRATDSGGLGENQRFDA